MLAAWLSARTRRVNFAVLRALGASPSQIASVLTWEQGIVYSAALLLGLLFGAVLSLTIVPTLVFTSTPFSGTLNQLSAIQFLDLQYLVPAQITLPPILGLLFAGLVIVCALSWGLMVRVVLRPAMSQQLRLNQD